MPTLSRPFGLGFTGWQPTYLYVTVSYSVWERVRLALRGRLCVAWCGSEVVPADPPTDPYPWPSKPVTGQVLFAGNLTMEDVERHRGEEDDADE
jgi:hypothetical protein